MLNFCTDEELHLEPILDKESEYMTFCERASQICAQQKGTNHFGTVLASLAVGYDLCFDLQRGNSVCYGEVFFGKDFALVQEKLIQGYKPLEEGYKQNTSSSNQSIFQDLLLRKSVPTFSPLFERMQMFIAEGEIIAEYRSKLKNNLITPFDRDYIENRMRYTQGLAPEIQDLYKGLLSSAQKKHFRW